MSKIEFNHTSLWYDEVIALNEVTFDFRPGITGLVGSNGAGKTSSIKLAAGLLKPTLGTITVDGESIWHNYEYYKRMGYSPEIDRQFSFMTGRQFLDWAGRFHSIPLRERKKRVGKILKEVGMTHAADRKIEGYSRGMRQRIKVAQSLINEPRVLLSDEPLSGTDPIGRNIMIDLFKTLALDEGVTIVVSSHVLHELERISDRVIVLESGKLVAEGKVSDVRVALSKIPQKLRISTNNAQELAKHIVQLVKGMDIVDDTELIVQVANRREFAEKLVDMVESTNIVINELAVLDEDLTSVFKLIKNSS